MHKPDLSSERITNQSTRAYSGTKKAGAGILAVTLSLAGCSGEVRDYTGDARTVDKGVAVYDGAKSLGSCGYVAEQITAVPVGAFVKTQENGDQSGQVMKYEFTVGAGGLALKQGAHCEGTVWVFSNETHAAG